MCAGMTMRLKGGWGGAVTSVQARFPSPATPLKGMLRST